MESKNLNALLHFKLLIKALIAISLLWTLIRDDVLLSLEGVISDSSELKEDFTDKLLEFGELMDFLVTKIINEEEFSYLETSIEGWEI